MWAPIKVAKTVGVQVLVDCFVDHNADDMLEVRCLGADRRSIIEHSERRMA
jgi:hypothetical protein